MSVQYFKRFRMEVDLSRLSEPPSLPAGFSWVPWGEHLVSQHAAVKYHSFRNELDSILFPCLGDYGGCLTLMSDIRSRPGFVPQATWLVRTETAGYVGTVQGVSETRLVGMIQNLGVVPEFRHRGLGRALLIKSLLGFREAGFLTGMLEVTADNQGAVRLYRSIGLRRSKTLYRSAGMEVE